jgi:hypothetical protein
MTFRCVLAVALATILPGAAAYADSVSRSVGGIQFDLAVPKGHCVLEETNSQDAKFIDSLSMLFKGASKTLIVATVKCDGRAKLRAGNAARLSDYAAYYVPDIWLNSTLNGKKSDLRKQLCNEMRKQGQKVLSDAKGVVAKAAKELNTNMLVTSTKLIGVLGEDDHGCYAGLLIGAKDAGGKVILTSSIVTSTVIHSKGLFLAYYDEYVSPETTQRGLQSSQAIAADLDRKNPE